MAGVTADAASALTTHFACGEQKQPIKQTLRDLRHGPLVSMTTQEGDDTEDSDAETPLDDSDAAKDKLRNAFGNHDLSGNSSDNTMLAVA